MPRLPRNPVRPQRAALGAVLACALLAAPAGPALAQDGTPLVRQQTATLTVTSPTPNAKVWIDNEPVGAAPWTGTLPAGNVSLRVAADFYDPFVRRVTLAPGKEVTIDATMTAGDGTVEFVVEPLGATLTLNRREEYPTPVRLQDLPPGDYDWELRKDGYEAVSGEFDFDRGQNLLIVRDLQSSAGRFVVESRPEGATVFLDGERLGQTPLSLEDIEPGVHQVLLELRGHAAVLRTIDTSDGRKGELDIRMPDKGASLVVKTPSPDGVVRLNDVTVGVGRRVHLPELERGRYTLAVEAPGMGSAETRIDVRDKGGSHWTAKLRGKDDRIESFTPAHRSWILWTGLGVVAGGATAGGVIAYNASVPDPTPEGDIVVSLP